MFVGVNIGQGHHAAETLVRGHNLPYPVIGQFSNQSILCIGSGPQKWEDFQISETAVNTNIVNLDPIYRHGSNMAHSAQFEEFLTGQGVASIAQTLPFKEASFDTVFSSWSMPLILFENLPLETATDEFMRVAGEISRVLRHGGAVHMQPISDLRAAKPARDKQKEITKATLKAVGFEEIKTSPYLISDRQNGSTLCGTRLTAVKK